MFRYPSDPNVNYIKRVVGLPGDVVRYTNDKRLFVNGQPVAEQLVGSEPGTWAVLSCTRKSSARPNT